MTGSVGDGERRVNDGLAVGRRLCGRRRAQYRSNAATLPLRWCTTTSSPGASFSVTTPSASSTDGSTGRWVHSSRALLAVQQLVDDVDDRRRRWRPPRSGRRSRWSGQPHAAAYGASVCTQRTLLEVTSRVGAVRASNGMSRAAWRLPSASSGRSRSSLRHDFRARALACRTHDQRAGAPLGVERLVQRALVEGVGEPLPGLAQRHPRDLVDLVVDEVVVDAWSPTTRPCQ